MPDPRQALYLQRARQFKAVGAGAAALADLHCAMALGASGGRELAALLLRLGCLGPAQRELAAWVPTRGDAEAARKLRLRAAVLADVPTLQPDWYALLGLTPGAGSADVQGAFRSLALQLHPDKATPALTPDAAKELFDLVRTAHRTLLDPQARREYDAAYPWLLHMLRPAE